MLKRTLIVWAVPAVVLMGAWRALADGPATRPAGEAAVEVTTRAVKLALFKNGYGVVTAEVVLPHAGGRYVTSLPHATLGSLLLSWDKSLVVSDVHAAARDLTEMRPAASVADVLEANIGKAVKVRIGEKDWREVRVVDFPRRAANADSERPFDPYLISDRAPRPGSFESPAGTTTVRGDIVLLEQNQEISAVPVGQIVEVKYSAQGLEGGAMVGQTRQRQVLEFTVAPGDATAAAASRPVVRISYLAQGIAWSPSYEVDISDDKKAVVTAKAVIVDDLMDLKDTPVELVTGFPHLEFAAPDAMTLTPLAELLNRIRSLGQEPRDYGMMANAAITQQQADFFRNDMPAGFPLTAVMGEGAEDLSFYPIPALTLAKGERAYSPLFAAPCEYEHIYTWDVTNLAEPESWRRNGSRDQQGQQGQQQVVWHALKLINDTDKPWTTGPGTTTKAGRLLGQGMMTYTPSRAGCELRITQAVAIGAQAAEYETDRKRSAAVFHGNSFDLVTVKGELSLMNLSDKPVQVRVTRAVSGELVKDDGNPETKTLAIRLGGVNLQTQMVWQIDVQPGSDKTAKVTYEYKTYVQ